MEIGDLITPDGVSYNGFKVTMGRMTDAASIHRTYDDIEAIFKVHEINYKTHEEDRPDGRFKSYSVES